MAYTSNLTKEEQKRLAQEKVEKSFAKINAGVISIFDKDALPVFLAFMAKLHDFDIYNLILIYKQRPTASYVAPYKTWEKISLNHWHDTARPVFLSSQKGQGIGIFAPYILKKKLSDVTDLKSAAIATKVISYLDYHVVFVFDESQMNGIPKPVYEWNPSRDKVVAEAIFHAFKEVAPFDIFLSADEDFKGNYKFKENEDSVNLRPELILNPKYRFDYLSLCNFILRILVVRFLDKLEEKNSADEFERIVECVSFVVANYLGLSTEGYFFFFANSWAETPSRMLEILHTVRQASHMLIERIEEEIIAYKIEIGNTEDIYGAEDDFLDFDELSFW